MSGDKEYRRSGSVVIQKGSGTLPFNQVDTSE